MLARQKKVDVYANPHGMEMIALLLHTITQNAIAVATAALAHLTTNVLHALKMRAMISIRHVSAMTDGQVLYVI